MAFRVLRVPITAFGLAMYRVDRRSPVSRCELRVDEVTGEALTAESKNATAAAYSKAKLFRRDPFSVEPSRKVCVLIGMTGVGKSATANTLCGAKRAFETSSSVVSVTSAVRVRDYSFSGSRWRVIDTPGLGDTNKAYEETKAELLETFRFAPHGIASFVVVVPKGRFTSEMEQRVREALDIFGGTEAIRHTMIAVTKCADAPEKLLDDIMHLPPDHTLRRLCEMVSQRVLPIENVKEPAIAVSRLLLHRGIDEVLELNNEERFWGRSSESFNKLTELSARSFGLDSLPQARCSTKWSEFESCPRLVIVCDFPSPVVKGAT
ncbi:unnamed protein product [Durusdinium trenchii]|uniref:GTPase IMAP family member 4 (Immunity-associated nucleotide 1 protein) (IAN-1) (HIAN1) (Immunity-associated protein 4) n=2 Tax=Durusdinium trenchii TaxID=1381693 RepID=A0ABP0HKQ8_9DINO